VKKINFFKAINFVQKKQPSKVLIQFCKDLMLMFPNSSYCRRKGFSIEKIQDFATKNDFTDVFIIGERNVN
jgi:rRNA maturation protein Rpf1